MDVEYESRLDQFRSFMLRANRYASLVESAATENRVVLVDDLPLLADDERQSHFCGTA